MQHDHSHELPRSPFSRRGFLKSGGLALLAAGFGGVPNFIVRAADNYQLVGPYKKPKLLVCIFQRGAMDGLMAVTPFTDSFLRKARPNLFLDASVSQGKDALLDLDGRFGLHPALASLQPFFKDKRLAIVHGVGSPNNSRSHFDAQDYMETGTPFSKSTSSGWLNRAVGLLGHDASPFRAVSLTNSLPKSFYGDEPALAISNLNDFAIQLRNNPMSAQMAAQSFESLYDQTSASLLKETGKESFEAIKMLSKADLKNYKPANDAVYPSSPLGNSLRQIAQLVKLDMGLEVAFTECGGWDTHVNQGTGNGLFARNIGDLGNSITAFWNDLGALQDNVTIMTMTEFGRTIHQNGTGGTDHGRASCLFVLGNDVNGGMVHGKIPELAIENLEDGRDLPVTTDFRAIFSEVAGNHLSINNQQALFPGWAGKTIGVMKNS